MWTVQVSPNESKWVQVSPSESKWFQVSPSESKWFQVSPSESKWVQASPNEYKWIQVSSSASAWVKVSLSDKLGNGSQPPSFPLSPEPPYQLQAGLIGISHFAFPQPSVVTTLRAAMWGRSLSWGEAQFVYTSLQNNLVYKRWTHYRYKVYSLPLTASSYYK